MMTPKSRICTKCGVEKPLDEFHKRKIGKFGRESRCKVCKAEHYQKNRERVLVRQRRYREANPGKLQEQDRRYYVKNRGRISEKKRQYREANPGKLRERARRYYEENLEKFAAKAAKRRAAKLNRTPAWADLDHIQQFYEARKAISDATGREYHVDHMIPLQGKTVSGLQVPSNLQIIPAERNISKNNSF